MTDEQLARLIEMLRLEKIDVANVTLKTVNQIWPLMNLTLRAFPAREFYDDDEWKFLKEIGLVKD